MTSQFNDMAEDGHTQSLAPAVFDYIRKRQTIERPRLLDFIQAGDG